MSTYKTSDPTTNIILDFISGGVPGNPNGESSGNYNAYFGNPLSRTALTKKTLTEIYAFQSQMLARDPRSTAIGRYQFLRDTLQGLQKKAQLSATAVFTAELQDQLAVELLKECGYQTWWRGRISDETFAHHISTKWASLPDPENDGRSHYDGDAVGNRALTTLTAVYAMLAAARAAKDVPAPMPPAPAPAPPEPAPAAAIDRVLLSHAIRVVQRLVGAEEDGLLGTKTVAAIKAAQRRA